MPRTTHLEQRRNAAGNWIMDAGGASRKFGVCHTAHFNAAPAESGFSLQLNNNDKILCTHAVPRGIRTHVCMEKKKRALRHAGAETHLLYYTKRYISVKSFLVKKRRERSAVESISLWLSLCITRKQETFLCFMGQTGIKLLKLAFFILTQSLARSLFSMYINPPIIKKCGVVLLSLCYTCHKHYVIFAAQAKTERARRSFERGCRHLQ
jgi:hypothetical protein